MNGALYDTDSLTRKTIKSVRLVSTNIERLPPEGHTHACSGCSLHVWLASVQSTKPVETFAGKEIPCSQENNILQ